MKRLHHPLWVHLPALVYLAATVNSLWHFIQSHATNVPLQFGFTGKVERYGSPWELLGITVIMLFYLLTSVLLDELWARQETRKKSFNWLSLFDDLIIGAMAGFLWGYVQQIMATRTVMTFHIPWDTIALTTVTAVIGAVVLELVRPWNPAPESEIVAETPEQQAALKKRLRAQSRWVHWEVQNPAWMSAAMLLASTVMIGGAIDSYKVTPGSSAALVIVAVAVVLLMVGGMRMRVTPGWLEVSIGLVGLRVFKLPLSSVDEVKPRTFSPICEFGGYGIRWNGKTTAYYFKGNQGVQLHTTAGKQYLIGSDHPQRLAAVIEVAKEVGTNGK